jgi:hypothetical protein
MVDPKVLIGVITGEYGRRADFYDYYNLMEKPEGSMALFCHDRSPAKGRNMIIQTAIEQGCTHILFLDDDMAYPANTILKLLAHDKDAVTGLYLSRAYPHQPLIFDEFDEDGKALYSYLTETTPPLKKVVAAGLGCVLIKVEALQKMEPPWVRLGELDIQEWCDDIGFFWRFYKAGLELYCDTTLHIGHIGTVSIWPKFVNGQWVVGYDTSGKGMISTPMVNPGQEYTVVNNDGTS